jgi:hypothetical protein
VQRLTLRRETLTLDSKLEKGALEAERQKIRELHQRQQDSLKCLQMLESKLSRVSLDDDETLRDSNASSRNPTVDFMATSQVPGDTQHANDTNVNIDYTTDDSETSESDGTITDTEEEHLTMEDLSKCAKHAQKLLKRISSLQQSLHDTQKTSQVFRYPKKRVHKLYRRFCQKFESEIVSVTPTNKIDSQPLPAFKPSSSVEGILETCSPDPSHHEPSSMRYYQGARTSHRGSRGMMSTLRALQSQHAHNDIPQPIPTQNMRIPLPTEPSACVSFRLGSASRRDCKVPARIASWSTRLTKMQQPDKEQGAPDPNPIQNARISPPPEPVSVTSSDRSNIRTPQMMMNTRRECETQRQRVRNTAVRSASQKHNRLAATCVASHRAVPRSLVMLYMPSFKNVTLTSYSCFIGCSGRHKSGPHGPTRV